MVFLLETADEVCYALAGSFVWEWPGDGMVGRGLVRDGMGSGTYMRSILYLTIKKGGMACGRGE
jgi:hypothetical protein